MIKFEKIFIGNAEEAFCENRFQDGVNIIFSDDNNKGKTIVTQGLYYALGNNPIFPSGFDCTEYYFILDFRVDDRAFSVCRKNKTFLVREDKKMDLFNSTSEFKRYFDVNILKLPRIIKDSKEKISDLELFFQLFFVGQDKRDTSKIFNSSYNNKDDFMDMLYSFAGCTTVSSDINVDEIKSKISILKDERGLLIKQGKILNKKTAPVSFATYTGDKDSFIKKIKEAEFIKNKLMSLKNDRNRSYNKKIKNEALLAEIRSLNRSLSEGALVCLDCHGQHIGYEDANKDISFDVSDTDIRRNITLAIQSRIDSIVEDVEHLDTEILIVQRQLKELMKDDEISLEYLLLYKKELQGSVCADDRISQIDNEIQKYEGLLTSAKTKITNASISKETLLEKILIEMNTFYKKLEPTGSINFDALFTKRDVNYSGSEECEFYLSKILACAKVLKHTFPVVMDSFREGELSTLKEDIIIKEFINLPNQVLFTATLKKQEENKYSSFSNINAIDYSQNATHHILNTLDKEAFLEKLKDFSIKLGPLSLMGPSSD